MYEDVSVSKEKILEATWELIKAEGIEDVTTRKIAARAETNSALVNYYFGSKEQLLNEVVKHHLESFREAFEVLDDTAIAPLARLRMFFLSYATLLLEHPGLAKRLLLQEELFASHFEYVAFLKRQGVEKLVSTIMEIVGPQPREQVLLMLRQMAGAIFFPLVLRGSFNPAISASLMDTTPPLEEQIDLFLARYFSSG
jgi:TetR/AcrR family transcriptional regulator, regulator of cefoperazone and chloramphenicol sensitivity